MATTVYGCVNRSTGQVEFDVCNTGDFKGCIERTGAHTGQVKVIISGTYCDDTYYGCVNRSTGQFQIIVPDDCCVATCDTKCIIVTFTQPTHCTEENELCVDGQPPWCSEANMPEGPFYLTLEGGYANLLDIGDGFFLDVDCTPETDKFLAGIWHDCCDEDDGAWAFAKQNIVGNGTPYNNTAQSPDDCGHGAVFTGVISGYGGTVSIESSDECV